MGFKSISIAAFCLPILLSAQSPWTRSKGGFYSQLAYHFIPTYDKAFGADGEEVSLPGKIFDGTIQAYGEYGVGKRTTTIISLPFRMFKLAESLGVGNVQNGSFSGMGNVTLGIRQSLYNKDWQLAATLRAELPTSKYDAKTGIRTGYDASTLTGLLSAGMGFKKAYAYAYAGYGHRTNDYSSIFNGGLEAGYHLKKLWLIVFSETVWAVSDGKVAFPAANELTRLYVDRQQYVSIGFKGIFEFNQFFGAFFSAAGVVDARNLPKSPGIGFGAFFKWE